MTPNRAGTGANAATTVNTKNKERIRYILLILGRAIGIDAIWRGGDMQRYRPQQ
jgi:hypothetical protein